MYEILDIISPFETALSWIRKNSIHSQSCRGNILDRGGLQAEDVDCGKAGKQRETAVIVFAAVKKLIGPASGNSGVSGEISLFGLVED